MGIQLLIIENSTSLTAVVFCVISVHYIAHEHMYYFQITNKVFSILFSVFREYDFY